MPLLGISMFKRVLLPRIVSVPYVLKLLLFISGFAILSVEILGVKVLAPYVGATMPIWGSVIGVTLIGGIFGYYAGGTIADNKRDRRIILALCVLAGLCIIAIPKLRECSLSS